MEKYCNNCGFTGHYYKECKFSYNELWNNTL